MLPSYLNCSNQPSCLPSILPPQTASSMPTTRASRPPSSSRLKTCDSRGARRPAWAARFTTRARCRCALGALLSSWETPGWCSNKVANCEAAKQPGQEGATGALARDTPFSCQLPCILPSNPNRAGGVQELRVCKPLPACLLLIQLTHLPLLSTSISSQVEFNNCEFVSNSAQNGAGAVSLGDGAIALFNKVVFEKNSAGEHINVCLPCRFWAGFQVPPS